MQLVNDDHLLINDIIHHAFTNNPYNQVEIIVRPECNQQCQYCYLQQQGKNLYPTHYSKETIKENISKLIDYFIERDYLICTLELFAGDMFYDDLFFEIMPEILKYYEFMNDKHHDYIEKCHSLTEGDRFAEPAIIIPCNMSFCAYPEKKDKVRKIKQDLEKLGIRLSFSYSTDGMYSTDIREKKNLPEEYFDNILSFCEENDWGLHPMISYEGIDNAIENYEWFKRKFKQFRVNFGSSIPMYLEVRNAGWDEKALQKYKEFILYFLDDIFHNFNCSNLKDFCENYFKVFFKEDNGTYYMSSDPPGIGRFPIVTTKHLPCTLGGATLVVYAGNLSIVPCHRLAYPEYQGAKFVTNTQNKLEIEATSFINAYLSMYYYNNTYSSNCQLCDYKHICLKGCPGAQYEYFADATMQIPSVCELLKVKYKTLLEYYHSIGLFHYLFKNEPKYPANIIFQDLLVKHGYLEYQVYKDLGDLTYVQ